MTLRTQVAFAAAGLTLILGLLSLLNPVVATRLLGLEVVAPRGLSEVRSVYGAMFLTMAGFMLWAVPLRPRAARLLRLLGGLWLGAAVGRGASMVIDGAPGLLNVVFFLVQCFVGGALVWASYEPPGAARAARARPARGQQPP